MSISSTAVVATSTGVNSYSVTATTSNTYYEASVTLAAGIYTVTCVSSTTSIVDFFSSDTTLAVSAKTVSGSVTVNAATPITKIGVATSTGSNITVSIALTGQAISATYNGVLDTLTTTQTYNQTGRMYVVAVAGGGGGGAGCGTNAGGSTTGNGAQGGFAGGFVYTNGATTVTVGAAGSGGAAPSGSGGTGGASSFGNVITTTGGNGGNGTTVNGGNGSNGSAGGPLTANPYTFVTSSTGNYGVAGNGVGNTNPQGNGSSGNAGGAGVVYVLRGL
jgi:hypothetical protein